MAVAIPARAFVFSVAVTVLAVTAPAQISQPIRTQAGLVQGTVETNLAVFKGIPFAAPPMGDLRWRAPEVPRPWT
jgi:para-nitrobenzyl esterase